MDKQILEKDISELVGLDALSPEEQQVFLSDVGDLVLEAALIKLVTSMTPDQATAITHYLDTDPEPEVFMDYLLKQHKSFATILEEEIVAFKEDAVAVLGKGAMVDAQRATVPA